MINESKTCFVAEKICKQPWNREKLVARSVLVSVVPTVSTDARRKFKTDYFNILTQKFDLPYFHQLVTGFHGNGNGICISCFRFSAVPCQLRAVNAIWLTARIQNSSILKWQRERKRKFLPSHFTSLSLFKNNTILWLSELLTDDYQTYMKSNHLSPE